MNLTDEVRNSLDKPELWSKFFYMLQNGYSTGLADTLFSAYDAEIITKEEYLPIVYIKGMEDKCFVYHYNVLYPYNLHQYDHALIDNNLESKIQFLKIWYIDRYIPSQIPQPIHDFINNGLSKINPEREDKDNKKVEGIKHDQDKLRFDLIPAKAMQSVAQVYTFGAKKYNDRNWEKGLSFSRLLGAAHRHINSFEAGEIVDSESGCHHLASAVFCLLAIIEFQHRNQNHLDDRVDYKKFEVNL